MPFLVEILLSLLAPVVLLGVLLLGAFHREHLLLVRRHVAAALVVVFET